MDFDFAIVGGGPAGSSTALFLARERGISPRKIVILDKAKFPRDKPCAGAVSAWGLDALRDIRVECTVPFAPILGLRVLDGVLSGESARHTLGIVARRSELDASLLELAANDGVVVRDGEGVTGLSTDVSGWSIETSRGRVRARWLVACDGAGSGVRKLLALREPARKGHLYVLETDVLATDHGPRAGLCDFDLSPSSRGIEGYYWDFPTRIAGAPAVSRGIYHANLTPSKEPKELLFKALEQRGVDPERVRPRPFSTRPFVRDSILAGPGWMLVGEAAGIDRTTGEGIAQAILMARIAAKHLARAARTGDARFQDYARDVFRSRVGRHLLQSAWLAERVYGPHGSRWRAFLATNDAARNAGATWYAGKRVGTFRKARLATSLAQSLLFANDPVS